MFSVDNNSKVIAKNLIFNNSNNGHNGRVVAVGALGDLVGDSSSFVAINCTFINNGAFTDIFLASFRNPSVYFYHCTFDDNSIIIRHNDNYTVNRVYSYNCIYTDYTAIGRNIAYNPPIDTMSISTGSNLIEGINGVTKNLVFGSNTHNGCYIIPLAYAKSATRLTNTFQTPPSMTATEILNYLEYDQVGNPRSTTGNVTYGAIEILICTLTVNNNGNGTTTPSGDSVLFPNSVAVLTAIPDDCYRFVNWTNTFGDTVSIKRIDTITVISDSVLIANFELIEPKLTLEVNPNNTGIVVGSGEYECNEKVIIEATANECYSFRNWTDRNGKVISTKAIDTITLVSDSVLTANFWKDEFILRTLVTPASNLFWAWGAGRYACSTQARIEVYTSSSCYTFLHWIDTLTKEIISEKMVDTILMDKDIVLLAVFEADTTFKLDLQSEPEIGGTVAEAGIFDCDETVTITATANAGYTFLHWTDGGYNWFSDNESETVLMDANKHFIAHFKEDVLEPGQFRVNLTSNLSGAMLVGRGIYDSNTVATIRATTTNNCYEFKHWQNTSDEVLSTLNPLNITVLSDTTLRAIFEIKTFELVLEASPTVGGTVFEEGTFDCNETVTITAVANVGYQFLRWTDENNIFFSNSEIETVTMNANKHFIAHFQILPDDGQFTVSLNSNISGVSFGGDGIHVSNATVTISATTTDNCYTFIEWRNSAGNFVSAENPYSFTVESDTVLTAIFEIKTYELTLEASPVIGGTVAEAGTFDCGETVEITAVVNSGYQFLRWTDENNIFFSSSETETVMMDANKHFIAHFEIIIIPPPDSATVILVSNPLFAGVLTGEVDYELNEEVPITATATANYLFINWTDKFDNVISAVEYFTLTVTQDTILYANFEEIQEPEKPTLTFRADEHKAVSPNATNYEIPIYISANKNVASIEIKKMVVEIERNIFYPKQASNCNLSRGFQSEIILENITVPALSAGQEIVLTVIFGDIILGDRDSCGINFIQGIEFLQAFDGNYLFENGHITLEICREGGDRLLTSLGYEPSLTVKKNPVTETLEIEIKVNRSR